MKSKFKTLIGAVLSLILVFTSIGFSFAEDEAKVPEKKYHLDIGVVSVIYQNGKWDMGRVYGQTLKVNPKLSFNEDVKVTRILTLDEAEKEGILWNKLTSHNIVSTLKGEDTKGKYEWNFDPSASASITNAKMIKAEGKNISYSVDVLLKEKDKVVNMMELYEHDCKKNGEEFASKVYKYWGGEEGLKAENMTMYNTVQSIRKGKVPSGIFYLIFVPTIIEYEAAVPDEKDEINIVPEEIENPYGSCSDKITWTETESHTYTVRKTRSDGSSYSVTRTCNHKYTYEAKLATMASLKSEKPNGGATLLKSGYGFSIILNNIEENRILHAQKNIEKQSLIMYNICCALSTKLCTPLVGMSGAVRSIIQRRWKKNQGGNKNGSNFNETIAGSRCTFRTPNKEMEP